MYTAVMRVHYGYADWSDHWTQRQTVTFESFVELVKFIEFTELSNSNCYISHVRCGKRHVHAI